MKMGLYKHYWIDKFYAHDKILVNESHLNKEDWLDHEVQLDNCAKKVKQSDRVLKYLKCEVLIEVDMELNYNVKE